MQKQKKNPHWLEEWFCSNYCDEAVKIGYHFLALPTYIYWVLVNYNYHFNMPWTTALEMYREDYFLLLWGYTLFKNAARFFQCKMISENGNCHNECAECQSSDKKGQGLKFVIMWLLSVPMIFLHYQGKNEALHLVISIMLVVVITFVFNKTFKHLIKKHGVKLGNNNIADNPKL